MEQECLNHDGRNDIAGGRRNLDFDVDDNNKPTSSAMSTLLLCIIIGQVRMHHHLHHQASPNYWQ